MRKLSLSNRFISSRVSKSLCGFIVAGGLGFFTNSALAASFTATSDAELLARLGDAANNGPSIDTITLQGTISTNLQIDIQTPVIIQGAPGFRVSRVIRTSTDGFQPLFNIQSPNVTIRNLLLFDEKGQNTNTQIAQDAANDTSNARLINIPYENANNQITNITITNNTFENTPVGIGSSGLFPRNLTVSNNDFNDVNRPVELLRDVGRVNNVFGVSESGVVLNGGTLDISNNRIRGNRIRLGISIDAGNDGVFLSSSFANIPGADPAARAHFSDRPVVFSTGSVINNNEIGNATGGANEFGIALATVENITVAGNTVSTTEDDIISTPELENNFTAGINVEHNSRNIVVDDNNIQVGTTGVFATGINVIAFQDHGSPLNHAQSSSNVTLIRNTITGVGQNLIFGFGYSNLVIQNNDASGFTTRDPNSVNVALFNVPCGFGNSTASSNTNFNFRPGFSGTGNAPLNFNQNGMVISLAEFNSLPCN